jgi:hypothetical protein
MEKILDILRSKPKQRTELDHWDPGRTTGCVIAHPAFGNTEPVSNLTGLQQPFFAVGYRPIFALRLKWTFCGVWKL